MKRVIFLLAVLGSLCTDHAENAMADARRLLGGRI